MGFRVDLVQHRKFYLSLLFLSLAPLCAIQCIFRFEFIGVGRTKLEIGFCTIIFRFFSFGMEIYLLTYR